MLKGSPFLLKSWLQQPDHSKQDTSTDFESWSTAARYIPLTSLDFSRGFFPAGVVPIPANPAVVIPGLFPTGLPAYQLQYTGGHVEGVNFATGGTIPFNSEITALFTAHNFKINDRLEIDAAIRWQRMVCKTKY